MTVTHAELESGCRDHFHNESIRSFLWTGVTVNVKDRNSKKDKVILSNVDGMVKEGELMAVMGPSGSGKSTLLHVLAQRSRSPITSAEGLLYLNGIPIDAKYLHRVSAYVQQEDALIGSLTVSETLDFAARLSTPSMSKTERLARIDTLLAAFGLSDLANDLIGTAIKKGISGGQKRRVSVAAQLVTGPRLLFLDEPTSGLDSAAAFEVMSYLKSVAQKYRLIVIASIHQPATSTFMMCDRLLLLCQGYTAYSGPVDRMVRHFYARGLPVPDRMNPAEFALDFVNTDFARSKEDAEQQLSEVTSSWYPSEQKKVTDGELSDELVRNSMGTEVTVDTTFASTPSNLSLIATLIHRSFLKSYRDVVVYGIRVAMYLSLALLMGTVWLRLEPDQDNIPAFVSAIFFGGAFMSFMAVAYIPAFLEDFNTFRVERANALYGPTPFLVANFLVSIPYLFCITLVFSLVEYWLSNFRPAADGFFTWVMWLFLDLVAAESLVVLVASLVPIFVVALAGTAFANGLWMCVGGSLRPVDGLNPFWRYVFHYIDYQSYVFQGMMHNEFGQRNFTCGPVLEGKCDCAYDTPLKGECLIKGDAIPASYGLGDAPATYSVFVMIAIIIAYRVLAWAVLVWKHD